MPAVSIGSLRERVTIQQKSQTDDAQGGRVTTWVTLEAVAAAIEPDGGTVEPLQAGAVTATARYTVRLRHRTDVTPTMRLRWRTRILQVLSVVSDARRAWLLLQCQEVQG